jgi:hypothetical protein
MAIPLEELEVIRDDLKRMIYSGVTSMTIDGRTYNSFSSMKDLERALALVNADIAAASESVKKTKVPIRNAVLGAGSGSLYNTR